jgi:hypothetical protein
MNAINEALNLVDIILTGKYKDYKTIKEAEEKIDDVLDEVENKIDPETDQDLQSLHSAVVDELTKDDLSSVEESIAISISRLIKEEEYREFFKRMLKKYNVSSPSELSPEKKKEFFHTIERDWKGKKE